MRLRTAAAAAALALLAPAVAGAQAPSGTITYSVVDARTAVSGIFSVPAAGGTPTRIVAGWASAPAVSPDGRRIAASITHPRSSTSGLYVLPATGGRATYLAPYSGIPAWSPNGRQVAYGYGLGIAIAPAGGGKVRHRFGSRGNPPDAFYNDPLWVASRLLFTRTANPPAVAGAPLPATRVMSAPARRGKARAIPMTTPAGLGLDQGELAISPDGSTLLVALYPTNPTIDSQPALGLVAVGGGTVRRIPGEWLHGDFSPDGTMLCVSPNPGPDGSQPISIIDLQGNVVSHLGVSGDDCDWTA